MFIPPPTPVLSKAEIEARRARLEAIHARNASSISSVANSDSSSEQKPSTTETGLFDNVSSRKFNIFGLGKDDKKIKSAREISAPILSPTTGVSESSASHQRSNEIDKDLTSPPSLPDSPYLSGRVARQYENSHAIASSAPDTPASPPRRPPRPAGHLSLESAMSSPGLYLSQRPSSARYSNDSESIGSIAKSSGSSQSSPLMDRFRRTASDRSAQSVASSASSQSLRAGVQSGRVDKGVSKRGSNISSSIDEESNALRELVKSKKQKKPKSKSNMAGRHKQTSSLEAALLGLGGVPQQPKRVAPKLSIHATPYVPVHQRLSAVAYRDRILPDTPGSIVKTPTELYDSSTWPLSDASRASRVAKTASKPYSFVSELSPGRLSAIPEHTSRYRQSPAHSGVSTPTKTQIHLRGGSVVTVTSPELDAWKKTAYIQGPIRLVKPAIIPRKNSLASLEPFQEAVEQLYQESLRGSRRHSDEAAAKEICDFFIHFGICDVYSRNDTVDVTPGGLSSEEMESDSDFDVPDSPEWSTRVVPRAAEVPVLDLPPVETEESLRRRGIARLKNSRVSKKASETKDGVCKADSVLTLVPLPEDNILDAVLASAVKFSDQDQDQPTGKEASAAINEVDTAAPWISSGNMHRKAAVPKRYSQ